MKEQTLLGIDYGESNIGIALGRNGFVNPLKVLSGKNTEVAIHEISRIALENKIGKFVLGLPLDASGRETRKSLEIRRFSKLLKIYTKKPVVFYDESLSSIEAAEEALETGVSQKRRETYDHLAAALILKRYFDSQEAVTKKGSK